MTATAPAAPEFAPLEPIALGDCPHCEGTGVVDDDYYVDGHGTMAAQFPCTWCEGERICEVDAGGACACPDCLHYPRDQRPGSGS